MEIALPYWPVSTYGAGRTLQTRPASTQVRDSGPRTQGGRLRSYHEIIQPEARPLTYSRTKSATMIKDTSKGLLVDIYV